MRKGPCVPRLVIARTGAPSPVRPDSGGASVQVWRDAQGTKLASCDVVDGQRRVDVEGVGRFHVDIRCDTVTAYARAGVSSATMEETYSRSVLPIVLQARGTEVLHASAVCAGGVLAFCGDSGAGKSTIAFGLSRRGHQLCADDSLAIGVRGPSAVAFPLPFEMRLRPRAAAFFGVEARTPDDRCRPSELPLAALFVLERSEGDLHGVGVSVERLRPPASVPALLAHAYCFSLEDPDLKRAMVGHYVDLAGRVPVFALRFRPGLEMLPPMLDRIEAVGRSLA